MVIALLLAAAAAQPSPEALALGKELASHGTLAALLPMIEAQQVAEIVKDHPELSVADRARLRDTADRVFEAGRDRIFTATGTAYAKALSVADLKQVINFYRSPAGARFEAALPKVIAGTAANMGKVDFKGDVLAAYCQQTGKLCGK